MSFWVFWTAVKSCVTMDALGNESAYPALASIILDTTPPSLRVSTLSDGSRTNNELLNVSGEVSDNIGLSQVLANGTDLVVAPDGGFSHPLSLQEGPNGINVTALDFAGNQTTDAREVYLDRTAPVITLLTPADNLKTNKSPVAVSGVVDETSSVTVKLNASEPVSAPLDGSSFNLAVMPDYGMNTLEVTATDLAENRSSVKRTMTFDDRKPSLSVTEPAQDVKTNKAAMTLRGETTDLTGIEVRITMDGNIYTPEVVEGKFWQAVVFEKQKTYRIYVTVTDEAGNETTVQRNVVYDTTAPLVTLDPAAVFTSLNRQVLTGTVNETATVNVTCSTATVSEVTYPTQTSWTVTLSNLKQGDNKITISAVDEAGNSAAPFSTTITVFSYSAGGAYVIYRCA